MGGQPRHYAPGFDEERDAMPGRMAASALTGIAPAQGASLILAIQPIRCRRLYDFRRHFDSKSKTFPAKPR